MTSSKRRDALEPASSRLTRADVMTPPKVTIMIPTYKQADVVGRAISSALAQSYPNLEVVVADDASPDATPSAVAPYRTDRRVRYFRNDPNLGRVGNYRKSLYEYASGDWVLNLDGDDYLSEATFIEKAVTAVSSLEDAVLFVGGQRFLEEDIYRDVRPTMQALEVLTGIDFFLGWVKPTDSVPHLAALYRRDVAMRLDFYRHDIISSDWESLRRLALQGKVVVSNVVAGVWTGHENNASKSLDLAAHINNLLSITEPYKYATRQLGPQPRLDEWKRQAVAGYAQFYVNLALERGQFGDAARFLGHLRKHHPNSLVPSLHKLVTNPKFFVRAALALGGPKFMQAVRRAWLKRTWKSV